MKNLVAFFFFFSRVCLSAFLLCLPKYILFLSPCYLSCYNIHSKLQWFFVVVVWFQKYDTFALIRSWCCISLFSSSGNIMHNSSVCIVRGCTLSPNCLILKTIWYGPVPVSQQYRISAEDLLLQYYASSNHMFLCQRVHTSTCPQGYGLIRYWCSLATKGGDLRKCLKANSLPQIGWHLGCWDWGNSMLRLLPLLGLAAALPMVPSDQSSVSFFCVILNSWFPLHLWHPILLLSGFFRWMPLLWLYPTWFSHLVACSQCSQQNLRLSVLSEPECTQQNFECTFNV